MISALKCKIKSDFPSNVYPGKDHDLAFQIFNNPSKIAIYYYFYKNKIKNPIYGFQSGNQVHITVGVNRLFGARFKKEETWLDAIIYTNETPFLSESIIWEGSLGNVKGKSGFEVSKKHEIHDGAQTMAEEYFMEKSRNARIDITMGNEIAIFNPYGKWNISEDVGNNKGIRPTLKKIFDLIDFKGHLSADA